jgi:hypothetical protein
VKANFSVPEGATRARGIDDPTANAVVHLFLIHSILLLCVVAPE